MAGKKKTSKKTDGRGGRRPGSGPKKVIKNFSADQKAAYIKAMEELAAEHGETIEKAVLRMVYDKKTQDSVKVAILKCLNEALLVKESEKTVTNYNQGLHVGLPPMRTDPAKIIPIDGGKK